MANPLWHLSFVTINKGRKGIFCTTLTLSRIAEIIMDFIQALHSRINLNAMYWSVLVFGSNWSLYWYLAVIWK